MSLLWLRLVVYPVFMFVCHSAALYRPGRITRSMYNGLQGDMAWCVQCKLPRNPGLQPHAESQAYAGGPLNKEKGDLLFSHGVKIFNLYGSYVHIDLEFRGCSD